MKIITNTVGKEKYLSYENRQFVRDMTKYYMLIHKHKTVDWDQFIEGMAYNNEVLFKVNMLLTKILIDNGYMLSTTKAYNNLTHENEIDGIEYNITQPKIKYNQVSFKDITIDPIGVNK